jgi:hypothetical protein
MAAVAAASAGDREGWQLPVVVVGTVVVVWLGHVYAHGLSESIARGRRIDLTELAGIGRRELPIPLAAVAPAAVLLAGAAGAIREQTAIWIALAVCLAALAVQGARYARIETLGRLATVAVILANVALGLLVVLLKLLVAH